MGQLLADNWVGGNKLTQTEQTDTVIVIFRQVNWYGARLSQANDQKVTKSKKSKRDFKSEPLISPSENTLNVIIIFILMG